MENRGLFKDGNILNMKKYYKESDVAGSINSSSELSRVNNTITVNGATLKPFVQPILSANGTLGGDVFAVADDDTAKFNPGAQQSPAWCAFDESETTGMQLHWCIIWYNPKPLLMSKFTYLTDGYYREDHHEKIVLYGSNTGEFAGEEEEITRNEAVVTLEKETITVDIPDNTKAYKYHKLFWEETTGWTLSGSVAPWLYSHNVPHVFDIKFILAYEVEANGDDYAKSLDIKQHVVTDVNGNLFIIPAQEFDVTTLENGVYYLYSNTETKKVEALLVETENKKDNLVKIGGLKLASNHLIVDCYNEEFNAIKKEHTYNFEKLKCIYDKEKDKTYMLKVPDFVRYKIDEDGGGTVEETHGADYDFFVVRPSFNVNDGGLICFKNGEGI